MCSPTSTVPAHPTAQPRPSTAGSSTSGDQRSDSAISPTTSPDPYSRPAASDRGYTLDREEPVSVVGDVHVLEMMQLRRPLVPGHPLRPGDDVVPVQRGDGDDGQVGDVEFGGKVGELVRDLFEHRLRPVHEVHLV